MNNNQCSFGVVSPRIYTYKITFEEVPYYYYGVHKEKKYNEEYWGSPKTNKWCWELYTPKKQILEFFDYNDHGWADALNVEKRLIKPVYNTDQYCLNECYGGVVSLEVSRKNGIKLYKDRKGFHALTKEQRQEIGKKIGIKLYKDKKGIHALTKEQRQEIGRKSGTEAYKNGTGIHALTKEQRQEFGRKEGIEAYKNGTGIHALTKEQRQEFGRKSGKIGGKVASSQRWKCLVTGHISTAAGLARYQRARGIDTSKRVRLE